MMFRAPLSPSTDNLSDITDLSLNEEEDQQPLGAKSGARKSRSLADPAYDPNEDDLESPRESEFIPTPLAQKRKLEPETIEKNVFSLGITSPSPHKKPRSRTPSDLNVKDIFSDQTEKDTSTTGTDASKFTNESEPQTPAPSEDQDLAERTSQEPPRRKSTIYNQDRNFADHDYVADDDDDEDNENQYTIPENERATVLFDFDRERDRRLANVVNIPKDTYTEKERALLLQLAMRGFEPLAPKHWQFDFPTLPDSLFPDPAKKKSDPIIKLSRSTTFYAIKSLGNLFSLSGRVRDCSILEKRPEGLIKQIIKNYIRWALYDVNLEIGPGSLPVHVIHAQRKNEAILDALERLNKRLQKLALRHQRALAEASGMPNIGKTPTSYEPSTPTDEHQIESPLLVGFIICGPIVAIMTFDVDLLRANDNSDGKFISQFDLSERGQDVWNSLSIAIAVMHIRNTMVRLSQNGYGGFVKPSKSGAANEDL